MWGFFDIDAELLDIDVGLFCILMLDFWDMDVRLFGY